MTTGQLFSAGTATKHAVSRRASQHGRPIEVLLVDDSYGDTLLTRQALTNSETATNVTIAEDGEQALRMLKRQGQFTRLPRPDIILLDLNLPKLGGREVLAEIKRDAELNTIPVVILSGSRAEAEVASTYALHANAYIAKPVNYANLQEIISAIESFWFNTALLPDGRRGTA
jgi:two-component system, chemotaxis family, response regulator Rcp1